MSNKITKKKKIIMIFLEKGNKKIIIKLPKKNFRLLFLSKNKLYKIKLCFSICVIFLWSYNNLDLYLKYIEVEKESLSLNEESLKTLTFGHVSHIAYQNQTIYNRLPLNLEPNALIQKLIVNKEGGMCYETSDLFFDVLIKLGFSAKRIKAYPLNGKPYNPIAPSSHNIIIVDLNSKLFLVDVGYGNNSMRYPVDFDFEKTNVKEVFPGENYKFEVTDNYYQLDIKIKGKYESMYRFDKPFDEINVEENIRIWRNDANKRLIS